MGKKPIKQKKPKEKLPRLHGECKRQANAPIKGYVYQLWQSVYAWIRLADDQVLYLEGAEDFDIVGDTKATAVQVKASSRKISLRSKDVIDAIIHCWQLRNDHPKKEILFRFLTTSNICPEKGAPLGIPGLELWRQCQRTHRRAKDLAAFLVDLTEIPADMKDFLQNACPSELSRQLYQPLTWETGAKDHEYVKGAVREYLVLHGEKFSVSPSDAESVSSPLFVQVCEVASSREGRCLNRADFLRIFEDKTKVSISSSKYHELTSRPRIDEQLVGVLAAKSGNGVSFQLCHAQNTAAPPIMHVVEKREQLVESCSRVLESTGFLVLTGSTGMGKTTLAKMIVKKANGNQWYWLSIPRQDPGITSRALRGFRGIIEQEPSSVNVVIDNIDMSPAECKQHEDLLGTLLSAVNTKNGSILITSQKAMPSTLANCLGLHESQCVSVPVFTEAEILRFAELLGCADRENIKQWAKILRLQTSGHPQLIHARLLYLSRKQWPKASLNDVVEVPSDVSKVRAEARGLLRDLPVDHRELIYRLSLVGLFRRDHAIACGNICPCLKNAGDVFDCLVGPWVEAISEKYYVLSPLLTAVANQVWTKEQVQNTHEALAISFLSCGDVTPIEASAIFLHAWIGRSQSVLAKAATGLITAPIEIQDAVYPDLFWFVHVRSGADRCLFPDSKMTSHMLRALQFRIARTTAKDYAGEIADAWSEEIESQKDLLPPKLYLSERLMFCLQMILQIEVSFPISRLVSFLEEIVGIGHQLPDARQILEDLKPLQTGKGLEPSPDYLSQLSAFIWPRCTCYSDLDELLVCLERIPPNLRHQMLSDFDAVPVNARTFIDDIWLHEHNADTPEWEGCIAVLQRGLKLAIEWDAPSLAAAAARAIAIIQDEYLSDSDAAMTTIVRVAGLIGDHVLLSNQRATLLYNNERYDEALVIWERILPTWSIPSPQADSITIWSYRKAAICAARMNDWKKASEFFTDGSCQATAFKMPFQIIGLLADAGFALWKTGDFDVMLAVFADVLNQLEGVDPTTHELQAFTMRKLVGHTLLWIAKITAREPTDELSPIAPGFCSDSKTNEKLRDLPDTKMDFLWVHLLRIEYMLCPKGGLFGAIGEKLLRTAPAIERSLIAYLKIGYSIRGSTFDDLPYDMESLYVAMKEAASDIGTGLSSEERANQGLDNIATRYRHTVGCVFVVCLIVKLTESSISRRLLTIWQETAQNISTSAPIIECLDDAERLLFLDAHDAAQKMNDGNASWEQQVFAAIAVVASDSAGVDELFCAHSILFCAITASEWKKDIADRFATFLSEKWSQLSHCPAVLLNPRTTLPDIGAACGDNTIGLQKAARIILAASAATRIRLSDKVLQNLREYATL